MFPKAIFRDKQKVKKDRYRNPLMEGIVGDLESIKDNKAAGYNGN